MQPSGRIVVGYDGSREAALAVRWAARHAKARGCGLQLVHCPTWQMVAVGPGSEPDLADGTSQHVAENLIEEATADVREVAPEIDVSSSLVYGWPAESLRKLSSRAELLVVGSRGVGGFMGLLVGSVSLELASTADCPVIVIRGPEHLDGPVVAGIGDEGWEIVLAQASLFALLAGAPLQIVHVIGRASSRSSKSAASAQETLASAVRSVGNTWPEIAIEDVPMRGVSIAGALLGAAARAQLLVVGSNVHGSLTAGIGSVAHAVLHHAPCPVLVARGKRTGPQAASGSSPGMFYRVDPGDDGRAWEL